MRAVTVCIVAPAAIRARAETVCAVVTNAPCSLLSSNHLEFSDGARPGAPITEWVLTCLSGQENLNLIFRSDRQTVFAISRPVPCPARETETAAAPRLISVSEARWLATSYFQRLGFSAAAPSYLNVRPIFFKRKLRFWSVDLVDGDRDTRRITSIYLDGQTGDLIDLDSSR